MKKIMFNDKYELTKAVLEGRKTQTRRLVQDEFFTLQWDVRDDTLVVENDWGDFIDIKDTKFCMFKIGETVSVAQRYKDCGGLMEDGTPRWDFIAQVVGGKNRGWSNKMFVKTELMPHQICINNVRIQRLQDISDEDCIKEGIRKDVRYSFIENVKQSDGDNLAFSCNFNSPREAYAALIDKVSGKGTWESNPYVFVYEFELVK